MISVPEESSALLLTQNHTLLRIDLVETDEEYFDDKCESRCAVLDADTFEVQHRTLYSLKSATVMKAPSFSLFSVIASFFKSSTPHFSHSLHYPQLLLCEDSTIFMTDLGRMAVLHSCDVSQFVNSPCSVKRSVILGNHVFLLVFAHQKPILLHLQEIDCKYHLLHYAPLPASTAVIDDCMQMSVSETSNSFEVYCTAPLTRPSILVVSLTAQTQLISVRPRLLHHVLVPPLALLATPRLRAHDRHPRPVAPHLLLHLPLRRRGRLHAPASAVRGAFPVLSLCGARGGRGRDEDPAVTVSGPLPEAVLHGMLLPAVCCRRDGHRPVRSGVLRSDDGGTTG